MYLFQLSAAKHVKLEQYVKVYEEHDKNVLSVLTEKLMEPELIHVVAEKLLAATISEENLYDEVEMRRYFVAAVFYERAYRSVIKGEKVMGQERAISNEEAMQRLSEEAAYISEQYHILVEPDDEFHGYVDGYVPDSSWFEGREENETYKELVRRKEELELEEERKRREEMERDIEDEELDEIEREEEYEREVANIQKEYDFYADPYENESLSDFERRAKNYDAEFDEE